MFFQRGQTPFVLSQDGFDGPERGGNIVYALVHLVKTSIQMVVVRPDSANHGDRNGHNERKGNEP
jgi:hypothetical protein